MSRLRPFIGIVVSLVLLGLFFRAISIGGLLASLGGVDYRGLAPAVLMYLGGVWVRALRWKLLVDPVARLPVGQLYRAVLIGFTVNNLLPARVGELARAMLLVRWAGVSPAATIGTIVVERLFDGLTLAAILAVGWLFVAPTGWLRDGALLASGAFVLAGLGVGVAAIRSDVMLALAGRAARVLPERLRQPALDLWAAFLDGLAVVRDPWTLGVVLGLSFVAWLAEAGMYYVIMLGFGLGSGPLSALLGMVAGNLGTMVPSSPSFIGTFDVPLQAVLVELFGVEPNLAASYTLVVHAALVTPVVIIGLALLSREGLSLGEVSRRADRRLRLGGSTDTARPAL